MDQGAAKNKSAKSTSASNMGGAATNGATARGGAATNGATARGGAATNGATAQGGAATNGATAQGGSANSRGAVAIPRGHTTKATNSNEATRAPRPKAPPPPSSRRELPAPTPLVLPARLQGATPVANASHKAPAAARSRQVAQSQIAAKQTLALKKAPPPPSSRRGQPKAPASNEVGGQSVARDANARHPDAARQTDAQWAAHLDAPRDGRGRMQNVPAEPPQLPDNLPLLNLEGEISALRPRPSELPPEPPELATTSSETEATSLPERTRSSADYRKKSPSDLSVLYQALPTNYPERSAGLAAARSTNAARSRGYVPKAPHEFLPPPPPPNKRGASKSFTGEEEDEAPTQARRPAILPYGGNAQQDAATNGVLTPQALRDSTPVPPVASMVVPAHARGISPIPPPTAMALATRLPPPPPLPSGLHAEAEAQWEDREWTDAKHLEAIQLAPVGPTRVDAGVFLTPVPPAAEPVESLRIDSVRPTALTLPAPASSGFPNFGLPVGWAPVAGASVLGAAISAGAFLLPARGQLLIDVSNQSWASLRDAQVYVNDELVCTQSPCAVKVDAAPQRVRVTAPGYQSSSEDSVIVSEGSVTLHKIQLGASADTGIEVQTSIPNLQLYVDGRRIGGLPRKVMGLPPGEHTLVVSGGDSFTTEERRIQLEPNQTLVINDLQPKLRVGALELRAGENANGARVTVDGAHVSLPFKGNLEPGRRYVVSAQRDGFEPFEQTLEIDPNNPIVNVAVALRPAEASEEAAEVAEPTSRWSRNRWRWQAAQRARALAAEGRTEPAVEEPEQAKPSSNEDEAGGDSALGAAMRQSVGLPAAAEPEKRDAKATGSGSINIVTSPSAVILLDGKPVGKTPKRITVSAGTHSLVLIHANGRKRASINVEAGANKTIKASF